MYCFGSSIIIENCITKMFAVGKKDVNNISESKRSNLESSLLLNNSRHVIESNSTCRYLNQTNTLNIVCIYFYHLFPHLTFVLPSVRNAGK